LPLLHVSDSVKKAPNSRLLQIRLATIRRLNVPNSAWTRLRRLVGPNDSDSPPNVLLVASLTLFDKRTSRVYGRTARVRLGRVLKCGKDVDKIQCDNFSSDDDENNIDIDATCSPDFDTNNNNNEDNKNKEMSSISRNICFSM
jgi:hypothetical protein